MALSIDHIAVPVRNPEDAARFLGEALGVEAAPDGRRRSMPRNSMPRNRVQPRSCSLTRPSARRTPVVDKTERASYAVGVVGGKAASGARMLGVE